MIRANKPDHDLPADVTGHADLPAESGSKRRVRLVDELRLAHRPSPRLSRVDDAVMRAIESQSDALPAVSRPRPRLGRRLSVPLAAVLAIAVGLGTYLHQQAPAAVSAQSILQHAARAGLVPNQPTGFVYTVTSSTGYSGTSQFWVEPAGPGKNVISFPLNDGFARQLANAVVVYGPGPSATTASQFMGQRTLDGVTVDIVQPYAGGPTIYVDAQSYLVRGVDWTEKKGSDAGSSWQARLLSYGTVPPSSVPAANRHQHNPAA
jgi:hypothetical protein